MKVIPTEEDKKRMEKFSNIIVSRRLTAPAIFMLESSKPLAFIGSQFLLFLQPFVTTFLDGKDYDRITELMEDKDNVELFIQTIEKTELDRKKTSKIKKENPITGEPVKEISTEVDDGHKERGY